MEGHYIGLLSGFLAEGPVSADVIPYSVIDISND
jgi:hypothetical protein